MIYCTISIFDVFLEMLTETVNKEFKVLHTGFAFHHSDWNFQNVCSPYTRIHFVKSGSARLHLHNKIYEMKPGYMYIVPAYINHGYECDDILELYYINFYQQPGQQLSLFDYYQFPAEVKAHSYDLQLIRRLVTINPGRELLQYDPRTLDNSIPSIRNIARLQQHPDASELETTGILQQLIARFLEKALFRNHQLDPRVKETLLYIANYIHQPIQIDTLAGICHLTKDHFIRLFRKEMRLTPVQFINRKKIEAAQLRILIGHESITGTAYSLGFENISYFNRLFKKETGMSPGAYKRLLKREGEKQ